jgi:hypothetical protein
MATVRSVYIRKPRGADLAREHEEELTTNEDLNIRN